jgi:hypothetical protein
MHGTNIILDNIRLLIKLLRRSIEYETIKKKNIIKSIINKKKATKPK